MDTIEVALPVYDDDGNQVDTTSVYLTREQVEDIVNTAAQVVYADRLWDGTDNDEAVVVFTMLAELDEALTSYSVVENPEED